MSKFKVGDWVTVSKDDESRLSDFEADLQSCLAEGDINGRTYDTIYSAIENDLPFVITLVQEEQDGYSTYETRIGRVSPPFMFEDRDLKPYVKDQTTH